MVVAVDTNGRVYGSDWGNSRIQVFDTEGTFVETWGKLGTSEGNLANPTGVEVDGEGNIWGRGPR